MNYLAHCCLVPPLPGALAGSVLGDVVHGRDLSPWPATVQQAIRLHRKVDTYTDNHPLVRECRERLQPPFRRYAGILLDVVFDHLLAKDFALYESRALRAVADATYADLNSVNHQLADDDQRRIAFIIRHDLLYAYRDWTIVERGLAGIGRRLRRDNPLAVAAPALLPLLPFLSDAFVQFYPQLKSWAAQQWVALESQTN